MTDSAPLLPMLDLRIVAGDVELRGIRDEDLGVLADVALAGVHDPARTPFVVPWTDAPPEQLPLRFAQYHWRTRADWSPEAWALNLGVWHRGRLIGVQGCSASDFLVTRCAETGSWLGLAHQGAGLGTRTRQALCAFLFDHLHAEVVTSGYFRDNPASGAVSRKVGYQENGVERRQRRPGEVAELIHLRLTPPDFVRGEPIDVHGLAAFRRSIGLDSD